MDVPNTIRPLDSRHYRREKMSGTTSQGGTCRPRDNSARIARAVVSAQSISGTVTQFKGDPLEMGVQQDGGKRCS